MAALDTWRYPNNLIMRLAAAVDIPDAAFPADIPARVIVCGVVLWNHYQHELATIKRRDSMFSLCKQCFVLSWEVKGRIHMINNRQLNISSTLHSCTNTDLTFNNSLVKVTNVCWVNRVVLDCIISYCTVTHCDWSLESMQLWREHKQGHKSKLTVVVIRKTSLLSSRSSETWHRQFQPLGYGIDPISLASCYSGTSVDFCLMFHFHTVTKTITPFFCMYLFLLHDRLKIVVCCWYQLAH